MLYGNIIFIKKTGGDGSKCPVTDKSIKIGRSEECSIRIYNNKVALEHCQLIIGDDGQATLKDLSNQTVLNGNISVHGEITLCHGDVFKVGERLARWEYLPTSKYYRQPLPSTPPVRLVAVVVPQKRSSDDQSTPGNSGSFSSHPENTSAEGKSRHSERFASENNSSVKMRKSSDSRKSKDMLKFLMGCHSLKTTKLILPGAKIKDRKSTIGIIHPKITKEKSRKSMMPSWKVNIVTPPSTSTGSSSSTKSQKKSNKSPQSTVPFKKALELQPDNLCDANKKRKSSKKISLAAEEIITESKSELKPVRESPLKKERSFRSNQRFSSYSPSSRVSTSSELVRLVHSEKKQKPGSVKSSSSKEFKRLSLVLNRADKNKLSLKKELNKNFSPTNLNSSKEGDIVNDSTSTPGRLKKSSRKSSVKKVVNNTFEHSTPGKSTTKNGLALKNLQTPVSKAQVSLIELDLADSKQQRQNSSLKKKNVSLTSAHVSETPGSRKKSVSKLKSSSSRKILDTTISSPSPSDGGTSGSSASCSIQVKTPRNSKLSVVESTKKVDLLKERTSPRGVRRGLSPSISTAERAAKKLKTSSPKKPDKNKKAALLVLGKANRKQFLSKNMKVLLKQKILKKAIKQSTLGNVQKNDNNIKGTGKSKPIKRSQEATSKPKTKRKGKGASNKANTPAKFPKSEEISLQGKGVAESTPIGEIIKEENLNNSKLIETPPQSSLKFRGLFNEASGKSLPNQFKKTEPSQPVLFKTPAEDVISLYEKTAENFLLNSNRRCSKRLSSKNDTGRPDFMELSPTALGLIPKNLEVFKTPNQKKRRSSSLETSKISQSIGIIKSASTSKIGNRKSVRFSSKDMSINSGFFSPTLCEKTDVDFGIYQTPDVSVDAFVSPLEVKSDTSKKRLCESSWKTFSPESSSKLSSIKTYESTSKPKKCVRKLLQSPKAEPLQGSRSSIKSPDSAKGQQQQPDHLAKNAQKDLNNVRGDLNCHSTPKMQKNQKNSLSNDAKNRSKNSLEDFRGIKRLLRTPKEQKSPKNDLSDLRGVKKLLGTPKVQKSPKNDLSDLRGVKRLLRSPKVQKSPKNDLSDLRGVKKLLGSPKVQKSPKNELSDLRGVKKLLGTPRVQRSPKNDLSDLRGVKRLLRSPKVQKSPKNDLSDLRGVKKLLRTPKVQKSPKNDLSDLRGVKKLLRTPKVQKSPKNDLSDLRGVKKLLRSPKVQKSPKNDLSDLRGVKKLLRTPKVQKSPKNDLTDVAGVKELLQSPKNEVLNQNEIHHSVGSPKFPSSLKKTSSNLGQGVHENFEELSKIRNSKENSAVGLKKPSKSFESSKGDTNDVLNVTDVKDLPVGKRRKLAPQNSRVNDSRGSRGRRAIYSSVKDPKNDLSDMSGVRELFLRHKPIDDYSVDLTGVAQLFDSPKDEVVPRTRSIRTTKKSTAGIQEISRALRSEKTIENEISTRSRSRKESATQETTTKRSARVKSKAEDEVKVESRSSERKLTTQKAAKRTRSVQSVKSPLVVKRSTGLTKLTKKSVKGSQKKTKAASKDNVEIQNTRKRKASTENTVPSPPKLRRKQTANEKFTSSGAETTSKVRSRSKTSETSGKTSAKKVVKVSGKVKGKASEAPSSKVQSKRSQSIMKKNLSDSQDAVSPVKTRNTRGKATQKRSKTQTTAVKSKTSRSTASRRTVPSVTKKSTKRK